MELNIKVDIDPDLLESTSDNDGIGHLVAAAVTERLAQR